MSVPRNDDEAELTAVEKAALAAMAAPAAVQAGLTVAHVANQVAHADLANAPLIHIPGQATRYRQDGKPFYAQTPNELRQTRGRRTTGSGSFAIPEKR